MPAPGSEADAKERRPCYGEQDENGVDISLIRELLGLSPQARLRRGDRARKDAIRLREHGRRHRQERS